MAPPEETTAAHAAAEAAAIEENLAAKTTGDQPISTIVIVVAMQTEALPLVAKFELSEDLDRSVFPKGVPWVRYHGTYKGLHINLVWPGKDAVLGVDSVGTVSASLLTYASIQAFKPDLIINAGTAGGFQAKGASIIDVYLASDVAFHDRRIPIPVIFDLYGIGARRTFSTPNLVKQLGIKVGKLSTGDSLDMCPQDESSITANDATLKDMEGAAVAYVADLLSVPTILIKAVTDIVDGPKPTAEEFMENVVAVSAALHYAVTEVVDFISGKSLSDL
ncbi:5'-methylthioadenosine/S-adenosylhomocysteine nucleosidase-like isoform X2 [Curcuma longa]|uniref:5'-methylthioadenosine/S-adenosylhomocysteine nucleosidase-like isoform X2 n=1 Tax=Curcuma longa TaxID=136217 RepID=UPI003D9FA0A6